MKTCLCLLTMIARDELNEFVVYATAVVSLADTSKRETEFFPININKTAMIRILRDIIAEKGQRACINHQINGETLIFSYS